MNGKTNTSMLLKYRFQKFAENRAGRGWERRIAAPFWPGPCPDGPARAHPVLARFLGPALGPGQVSGSNFSKMLPVSAGPTPGQTSSSLAKTQSILDQVGPRSVAGWRRTRRGRVRAGPGPLSSPTSMLLHSFLLLLFLWSEAPAFSAALCKSLLATNTAAHLWVQQRLCPKSQGRHEICAVPAWSLP